MILVLTGTSKFPFYRLLKHLNVLKANNLIEEEILAQVGHTEIKLSHITSLSFVDAIKLTQLIKSASLIISHAGTGSAQAVLKLNKPLILVPRLKKYNEAIDDHQLELSQAYQKDKYCLQLLEEEDLLALIQKAKNFPFRSFKSNSKNASKFILNLINDSL